MSLQVCVRLRGPLPAVGRGPARDIPDSGSLPSVQRPSPCTVLSPRHTRRGSPRQSVCCVGLHRTLPRLGDLASTCPPGWSALGPPAGLPGISELQPSLECWRQRRSAPISPSVLTVCEPPPGPPCSHGERRVSMNLRFGLGGHVEVNTRGRACSRGRQRKLHAFP